MRAIEAAGLLAKAGVASSLIGDPDMEFGEFRPFWQGVAGCAVFLWRASASYPAMDGPASVPSLLITTSALAAQFVGKIPAIITVAAPRAAFAVVQTALLGIGAAQISPLAVVEHCLVGRDVQIEPFCHVGGDGLSANRTGNRQLHTPHGGIVRLGDRVRLESMTVIERAVMGETVVGDDCQFGNGNNVGHGSVIGKRLACAARVIICGHCEIGDDVRLGAGVVLREGTRVGDRAFVGMGAVVVRDVPADVVVAGNPARILKGSVAPW
jgi:UDP-3-O-[3-hydroxymyristoyl] glucosamine N-acyltransferase